jgi:hypothetical protein
MRSRDEVAEYSWEFNRAECIFKDGTHIEYACDIYDFCELIGKEIISDLGGEWVEDKYDLSYDDEGFMATNMVSVAHYTPYQEEMRTLFLNLKLIK